MSGKKRNGTIGIGQRFGMLTVVASSGKNKKNEFQWSCRCDCGSSACATSSRLRLGSKTHCGCKARVPGKHLSPEFSAKVAAIRLAKKIGISPEEYRRHRELGERWCSKHGWYKSSFCAPCRKGTATGAKQKKLEQIQRGEELIRKGFADSEVAMECGATANAVGLWRLGMRRRGEDCISQVQRAQQERREMALGLLRTGKTVSEISRLTGLCAGAIRLLREREPDIERHAREAREQGSALVVRGEQLIRNGLTNAEVARECGVLFGVASRWRANMHKRGDVVVAKAQQEKEARHQHAKELLKDGRSQSAISTETGVSPMTLRAWRRAMLQSSPHPPEWLALVDTARELGMRENFIDRMIEGAPTEFTDEEIDLLSAFDAGFGKAQGEIDIVGLRATGT